MKRTMLWMLVVLLLAAVASPAAAGVFMADLFKASDNTRCGTILVSGNMILVDLKLTGACAPSVAPTPNANTHALCRVDFANASVFVANLVDKAPPSLGRIVGPEGIVRGALSPGDEVAFFEIYSNNGDCTGSRNYISGFVK